MIQGVGVILSIQKHDCNLLVGNKESWVDASRELVHLVLRRGNSKQRFRGRNSIHTINLGIVEEEISIQATGLETLTALVHLNDVLENSGKDGRAMVLEFVNSRKMGNGHRVHGAKDIVISLGGGVNARTTTLIDISFDEGINSVPVVQFAEQLPVGMSV